MRDMVIDVTDEDFQQVVLGSEQPVIVEFWAEWCVPCLLIARVVVEIAAEQAGKLGVVKLNVDDSPKTTERFGVLTIPTLIVFADGEERARVVGLRDKASIMGAVSDALAA